MDEDWPNPATAYAEMAADEEREAESREWSESLLSGLEWGEPPPDPNYAATP